MLYNLFSIAAMLGLTPYVATVGHATAWGVSASGVVQLFMKEGGLASGRPLFDSGTPSLPGFAPPARFTF